jgi:uncharacterized protein (TIGR03086 family)
MVALIGRGVRMTGDVVAGITDDRWSAPSPCAGWTVRDVLNHVVGGMRIFAAELDGRQPEAAHEAEWLGADPVAAYTEAAEMDLDAWRTPGAMSGSVTISLGQLPAGFAAVVHVLELVAHGVDLAVATDQVHLVDQELCEEVLGLLTAMGGVDDYRLPGVFGPEVPVDLGAPAHERVSGYLGRHLTADMTATGAVAP